MISLRSAAMLLFLAWFGAAPASVEFSNTSPVAASEGHVLLDWTGTETAERYQLQHRFDDGPFRTVYEGPDTASFRSGLPAGLHQFRVRAVAPVGDFSSVIDVAVSYPTLRSASIWLGLGALVLVCTVVALLAGIRRRRAAP